MNSHRFKLYRAYSISFTSSNVGKCFWSWILKDCIKVQEKKRKLLSSVPVLDKTWIQALSRCSRATTAKKCTKKAWSRAKLVFCWSNMLLFLPFSLPSASSLLKLPIIYNGTSGGEGRSGGRFPSAGEGDQWPRNRRGETKAHRMVSQVNRRIPWIPRLEHDNRLVASSGKVWVLPCPTHVSSDSSFVVPRPEQSDSWFQLSQLLFVQNKKERAKIIIQVWG